MARVSHVAKYGGKRACQATTTTEEGQTLRCGVSVTKHPAQFETLTAPRPFHLFDGGKLRCEKCGTDINKGDPYKWVKTRTHRAAQGHKRNRCTTCPAWTSSELTSSPFLQTLYAATETAPEMDTPDVDVTEWEDFQAGIEEALDMVTDQIEDLKAHYAGAAEEASEIRTDAADNIEEGFGHETYQSEELREQGEAAQEAADQIAEVEISCDLDTLTDGGDIDEDSDLEALLQVLTDAAEDAIAEIEGYFEEAQG